MNTTATEDYLKTIYAHTEWQPDPITPSQLAAKLGVAPPSATQMVSRLAEAGLVSRVPYGPITLTDAGLAAASAVVRKHRLLETWLLREMGYTWDTVHDEAEILEHAVSDRLLEAIDARLGRPDRDPHGDPIPAADGSVTRRNASTLADAVIGERCTIQRISDRDPALLRELDAHAIGIGTVLDVSGRTETSITIGAASANLTLTVDASRNVWISLEG